MQEILRTKSNAITYFSNLTAPQAIVISSGVVAASILLGIALSHGWAPDFDFSNNRFRFVYQGIPQPVA